MPLSPRRIAARYLSSAVGARLSPKVRTQANDALIKAGMDGTGRFRSPGTALARISEVLGSHEVKLGESIQNFSLKEPKGQIAVGLSLINSEGAPSPKTLDNTRLSFHWYRLEDGQYEVVAYLN